MALAAADSASVNVLGWVASEGEELLMGQENWEKVYDLARKALRTQGRDLPQGLALRVLRAHRLRNMAVHLGTEPAPSEVIRAIAAAKDLMAFAAGGSPLLALLAGAGPLHAVAQLVQIPAISDPLREAGDDLAAEDHVKAADHAALALDAALARVNPPLRQSHHRRPPHFSGWGLQLPQEFRQIEDYLSDTDQRLSLMDEWLLAVAVGLPPAELNTLRNTLGRPTYYADNHVEFHRSGALTPAAVHRCALDAASLIYRLWQADAVALLHWEVVVAKRAAAEAAVSAIDQVPE